MFSNNSHLDFSAFVDLSDKAKIRVLGDVISFNSFDIKEETFQDWITFNKRRRGE